MLLLGSCSKDVDNSPSGSGGEGGVVEGIPTYATISLSQRSGAGTYAGAGDYVGGTSNATAAEKKINDAAVLVFNNNNVLENFVKFEQMDIDAEPYAKTFATTTGKKRLYALANLGDYSAIEAIFNSQTATDKQLSNVCKVIQQITTIADAANTTAGNENFRMSNVYKLGATIEDQVEVLNVDEEDVKGGTGDDPTKNNFKVYIGRMVSKVTPTFAADLVINSGDGTIDKTDAEYRVRNNPKRFYTFPVYEGVQLVSPYYALDFVETPGGGEEETDPEDPGTYAYPTDITSDDFFDNGTNADFGTNMGDDSYLTENSPKEAKRHKVTFLSIKAKWTPDENAVFLAADGTVADATTTLEKITGAAPNGNGGTFWRVQKWENGKITGYCPGIYADKPTGYVDGTPGVDEPATTNLKATREEAKASETACYLPVEYTGGGTSYWAYWMRSRLDGTIAEKYALKRNNHFKVNIISVDGVGDPTEDDNLDKEEDIEADASMKATIEVLNWNVVDIEGGI